MSLQRRSLKILLTNVWMDRRGGTESVIRDIALGLLRRGHRPIVYSPHLGDPARELRARGVSVVGSLNQIADPPDVIHGQHYIQTAEAGFHFPDAPIVQMCHAWDFWQERPAKLAQVRRYLAVDQTVNDRLVHNEGVDPGKVEILLNAVDLERLPTRPAPLPARPATALVFTKFKAHIPLIETACRRHGIQLSGLGQGTDQVVAHPERSLVKFDIVFATARMALEAACGGSAVVVCDSRGLAGMLRSDNLAQMRPLNFGLRALVHGVSVERLEAEIARYDAADAAQVAATLRRTASLEPMLDRLEAIYCEVIDQAASAPLDPAAVRRAQLEFLEDALPRQRSDGRWPWMPEREALLARIATLENELAAARTATG
jgi:hypothetical protein